MAVVAINFAHIEFFLLHLPALSPTTNACQYVPVAYTRAANYYTAIPGKITHANILCCSFRK